MDAGQDTPFVAPPTVAFPQFGHEEFVEQQLTIRGDLSTRLKHGDKGQLAANQGVVCRAKAVFPRPERCHRNEVMGLNPSLKSDIVRTPLHGAKHGTAPAAAQRNFGPLRGEPPVCTVSANT